MTKTNKVTFFIDLIPVRTATQLNQMKINVSTEYLLKVQFMKNHFS